MLERRPDTEKIGLYAKSTRSAFWPTRRSWLSVSRSRRLRTTAKIYEAIGRLKERYPIFHHLERRVETHIFLCVLAYHLLVCIERAFLEQGIHTSWETCAISFPLTRWSPCDCRPPMA